MSHNNNNNNKKNNENKKKSQPQLILNNSGKNPKKTEKKKQLNLISQTNRNSKQNNLLYTHGDLLKQQLLIDRQQSNATGSPVTSPGLYSTSSEDNHNIHIQLAIQQSLQTLNRPIDCDMTQLSNATTTNSTSNTSDATKFNTFEEDELEADFYDITSSDCEEDEDYEEEEDIENWELLDESSSSLVNLNKPYSFSNIEFPVLKTPKPTPASNNSGNIQTAQPLENPWLNSKVLIKSITQQS